MKTPLLIFLIVLFGFECYGQQVTAKQLKDSVIWRQGYTLTKEDFKAKPKGGASIFSSIGMFMYVRENEGIVFVVESIFLKSKSFMKSGSDYSLKHEQIIFDLCELHSRKLRKRISEKNFNKSKNISSELNELYNKEYNEFNKEREKYEKETEFGLNMVKQQNWAEKIAKELIELEQFSSTEVNVLVK